MLVRANIPIACPIDLRLIDPCSRLGAHSVLSLLHGKDNKTPRPHLNPWGGSEFAHAPARLVATHRDKRLGVKISRTLVPVCGKLCEQTNESPVGMIVETG
jgi:hypothetical protein